MNRKQQKVGHRLKQISSKLLAFYTFLSPPPPFSPIAPMQA
ncbi:hypothetical protein ACU8KH_06609 [Lachancea thermotolerans]